MNNRLNEQMFSIFGSGSTNPFNFTNKAACFGIAYMEVPYHWLAVKNFFNQVVYICVAH